MRFGYVLLGLVTLMSIHTSSGQCSNGFAGVQEGDICCDADCGRCGGSGCNRLPGGSNSCCTSTIRDRGIFCSSTQDAPCIVRSNARCSNGFPGVDKDDICCDASCGTCGGPGCSSRPGGVNACCTSRIRASRRMCNGNVQAPCIMDDPTFAFTFIPTNAPTIAPAPGPDGTPIAPPTAPPTTIPVPTCSNGLLGFGNGPICCELQCGTCGGSGCGGRPGGVAGCCSNAITRSEVLCSETLVAPCIIDN